MTIDSSSGAASRPAGAIGGRRDAAAGISRDRVSPETKSRFEDALERRGERKPERDGTDAVRLTADGAPLAQPQTGRDSDGDGQDRRRDRRTAAFEAVAALGPAAIVPDVPVATGTVAPAAPADAPPSLSSHHAEFAARLDLPDRPVDSVLQLSMPDTRWLASQAVIQRVSDGGLTLDVETRGDGDHDRQRDALRARLEARGHRIADLSFDRPKADARVTEQ